MLKLYVIICYDYRETFIKIGITSSNVRRRFGCHKGLTKAMPYRYKSLFEIEGQNDFIMDIEKKLLKTFNDEDQYIPMIKFGGYLECINIENLSDILLHLDYFINPSLYE